MNSSTVHFGLTSSILFLFPKPIYFYMGALCVPLCMVLAATSPSLHPAPHFPEHCLPKKTPVSRGPISKLAASQLLLLSLVSTWHFSHCFQAQKSFPCLFLLLFRVFLLLFLQIQLPPGAVSPELSLPLCSSPSPWFFMLLFPITFSRSEEFVCDGRIKSYIGLFCFVLLLINKVYSVLFGEFLL